MAITAPLPHAEKHGLPMYWPPRWVWTCKGGCKGKWAGFDKQPQVDEHSGEFLCGTCYDKRMAMHKVPVSAQ